MRGAPHIVATAGGPPAVDRLTARTVLPVMALAIATRLLYLFVLTQPGRVRSDAGQYHEIARNLAAGRGLASTFPQIEVHATAFRPPLYPLVLSGAHRLTGSSIVGGKLLNLVIGVAVVVLAMVVANRVGGRRAALGAGVLVAVFPPIVANDVNLLTEPLGLLLLLAVVLFVADDRWLLAGLATGALTLTRPSAQLLVVLVVVVVGRRLGWRRAAGVLGVVLLTVAPWLVRNHLQVGTWNMYTSNGFNVAAIYSEPAQESDRFVDPVYDPRFAAHRLSQFDEAAWDREMLRIGLEGLRANPFHVVETVARNAAGMFELRPSSTVWAETVDGRNLTVKNLALPLFHVVSVLGVVGILRHRGRTEVQLLGVSAVYFTVTSLFLVAPPRLRAPWDLAVCIGAALVVAGWYAARPSRPAVARPAEPDPREVVAGVR